MQMNKAFEKINEYFDELVPNVGAAETKAGELVRAVSRIGFRFYNDGDHIGVGYGNETCNPAARFVASVGEQFAEVINGLWGLTNDDAYEKGFNLLAERVVEYIEEHPESKVEENDIDFNEFYYRDEDFEYEEEDEDYGNPFEEPWAVYDPDPVMEGME